MSALRGPRRHVVWLVAASLVATVESAGAQETDPAAPAASAAPAAPVKVRVHVFTRRGQPEVQVYESEQLLCRTEVPLPPSPRPGAVRHPGQRADFASCTVEVPAGASLSLRVKDRPSKEIVAPTAGADVDVKVEKTWSAAEPLGMLAFVVGAIGVGVGGVFLVAARGDQPCLACLGVMGGGALVAAGGAFLRWGHSAETQTEMAPARASVTDGETVRSNQSRALPPTVPGRFVPFGYGFAF